MCTAQARGTVVQRVQLWRASLEASLKCLILRILVSQALDILDRNEYQNKRQKTATNLRKDRTQNKLTDKNFIKSDVWLSISEDRRQTQLQDNGPVRYKQIHVTCESPHFVEDEGLSAAKSKRRTPLIGWVNFG